MSRSRLAVSRRLADHAGVPFVTLESTAGSGDDYRPIDPAARTLLSPALCRELGMLPIAVQDGTVLIAAAEPVQYLPYEVAAALGGRPVRFVVAPADQLARAMGQGATPTARRKGAARP
jgi:hypothetical protein